MTIKKFYALFFFLIALMAFDITLKAQSIDITGPAGSEQFGKNVTVLTNGNYVVTDPLFDDGAIENVGAVYLYNGSTHALISTLIGSTANDRIGYGQITALSNGNYVVNSYFWNNGEIPSAGAITWCDGSTGISGVVSNSNSLVGSRANDQIGNFGIIALSNGNYVIMSPYWDNGAIENAGAVTWGNGNAGISGTVSSSNSLLGSTENDQIGFGVGYGGVTLLSNGNYIVSSPDWDNGAIKDAGAVTWANSNSGISGVISSSNSLLGSTENDKVGIHDVHIQSAITELSNGNYVVSSPNWDNGAITDAGAVTWGNGSTGISGVISSSNSLVGSTENDHIGRYLSSYQSAVIALSNGNYVVGSPFWDNGAIENAGAVTWGNGSTGKTGVISSSNSLVGSTANDRVGDGGSGQIPIIALMNGNYVICSSSWDNGEITDAGATTWGDGNVGISGAISSNNSLVGSIANDQIGFGGVTNLSNGNYLVRSPAWNNGSVPYAGAVTWGNGTIGLSGEVNSSNSLVGSSSNDQVGSGITVLSNGNYVVSSYQWSNGSVLYTGAVTWGNGSTGTSGVVSSNNSLVGSTANDFVGYYITALTNGNYVVTSNEWDNGTIVNAGAATWGNGNSGISGEVSASNSLVGSTTNDKVGYTVPLTNGNYVVLSSSWNDGAIPYVGAATWGDGSVGIMGEVSHGNSLVGSTAYDGVGSNFIALSNGNYVVSSSYWDNGSITDAGAVTWGNGSMGISGEVSSSNSLVGSKANDLVGAQFGSGGGIFDIDNGNYVISSPAWDNGTLLYAGGAVTWGNGSIGVAGVITPCNSVLGTSAANGQYIESIYNSIYGYLIVARFSDNIVTIYNPSELALANSLDEVNVNINGTNSVPLIVNSNCRIIAALTPNGGSPVNGIVDAKVWIEPTVPTFASKPFVARHYEITPENNTSTATAKVTLYFTQQEFDDFNAHPGSILNLPVNSTDVAGKANIRIGKYPGISNDGSGLPGTYSQDASVINPDDEDIKWNAAQNRWEVSFNVTGFSGFIVQTSATVLPLTLLDFNGSLQNDNALLNWKTANEQNTKSFDVERSSNGRIFSSIGNVSAANTTGVHQYGYTDYNITTLGVPVVYYRLKQLDTDGIFVYSKIIALSVENKNIVLIYPNPATNELNLSVTAVKGEQAQLRIIDNKGRVMKQKQVNLLSGSTFLSIDISSLSKGIFYIELKGEGINERKSFVKQ